MNFYLFIYLFLMQIGPFQASSNEKARIKVKVQLNLHGIVTVESAMVRIFSSLRSPF